MKIGDEVYIHGYVDEIRDGVVIIQNDGGYFGTAPTEIKSLDDLTLDYMPCNEVDARCDKAYQDGYKKGYEQRRSEEGECSRDIVDYTYGRLKLYDESTFNAALSQRHEEAYKIGCKDAWKLAAKIDAMKNIEFMECFGGKVQMSVFCELVYEDALHLYRDWKDHKEETERATRDFEERLKKGYYKTQREEAAKMDRMGCEDVKKKDDEEYKIMFEKLLTQYIEYVKEKYGWE